MSAQNREYETLKQRVDILAGARTASVRNQAAVQIGDLKGLMATPPTLKSVKAAGSEPTKAEFDALVDDVHELHRRLLSVVEALRGRLGR